MSGGGVTHRRARLRMACVGIASLLVSVVPGLVHGSGPQDALPLAEAGIEKSRGASADGTETVLATPDGTVRCWQPANYEPASAGLVLFVHGYRTSAAEAWDSWDLAGQFRAAGRNALYVMPEAPPSAAARLRWPSLPALLDHLRQEMGEAFPAGPVVIMGHSGGYRTLTSWLQTGGDRVQSVILLDALYADEAVYAGWVTGRESNRRRQILLVGRETARRCARFVRRFASKATFGKIPSGPTKATKPLLARPVVYFRSQYTHHALVRGGAAIPTLLRMSPLPAASTPRPAQPQDSASGSAGRSPRGRTGRTA